jgi:hypothetical protein
METTQNHMVTTLKNAARPEKRPEKRKNKGEEKDGSRQILQTRKEGA